MFEANILKRDFQELYGEEARIWSAPGRVNLIGEHTDYNDGFVLPMAINRRTFVAAAARRADDDRRVRVRSLNLEETAEFNLDQTGVAQHGSWINYVEGVARTLEARGVHLKGADLAIGSNVPIGGGLSSSAALEVAVGLALTEIAGVEIDKLQLALAGQQAEHLYVGINSGIMDQFVAALGRRGHALLIDCRALEAALIPLNIPGVAIVVCDTNVKHALASSEYNVRRAECERGVEILRQALPDIYALRDVSVADFQKYEMLLPEQIRSRCRHVITENARTLAAADALMNDNLAEMGRLMALSHNSLRDDYQVSSAELDLLVEIAWREKGTIGARMTGGGFGGCTVNLVEHEALEEFSMCISREYEKITNIEPTIYVVEADHGAHEN